MSLDPAPSAAPSVPWPDAARAAQFDAWAASLDPRFGLQWHALEPASSDASFRRYLRVPGRDASFIVMDAPPALESLVPFVQVAGLLERAGLHAPRVHAADAARGFALLSDLGRELLIDALGDPARTEPLMRQALQTLVRWQLDVPADALPAFDEAVLRDELALFPEWCVQRRFGVQWGAAEQGHWLRVCDRLVASALAQPQLAVHRDWMPRNLMVSPDGTLGILDFQDAARGPLTYDLASLLRDAFISWDEAQQIDWAVRWWQQARKAGVPLGDAFEADFGEFWRALEWMGLQRHLRILGVFSRLELRDGKPHYSADLPRFFGYATQVAMRYAPLAGLVPLLEPLSGRRVESGYTF